MHIQSNQQLSLFEISNYFEERRHHPDDINLKSFFDLAASIVSAYRNSNYHWLLVEGKEDMQYLTYYLNDVNINILPLSGCGNVKKIYEYLFTPMSNAKNEVPGAKEYKILCLIDTDALATTISVSSSTKNRLLCIKRWHEDQNTHKIGLLDIDSPIYQPTEIEEVLEPQLFYTALETCINKYGTDSEKNAFGAFELDGSVEFSRIKGDNSMLNHLGNGRNIREDKKTIMDFIEKMKSQIASEYVQLPKTGRQLSWVDTIENLLS